MKVILSTPFSNRSKSPNRELSPVPQVTPKMRLETLRTYLECNAQSKLLVSPSRRSVSNMFEHTLALMSLVALVLFVAFLIWIVVFTKVKLEEKQLEMEEKQLLRKGSMFFQ